MGIPHCHTGTGTAQGWDLQKGICSQTPLCLCFQLLVFCQAEQCLEWGMCMRRPSSPQAWATWDKASNPGLLLTSPNFSPFRTQNNDNTLPGKEIPLGLCKISSVLTVPLSLKLCGAAWLINTLGSFQDPLLSPLQREPGGSQAASPSTARGAPLTLTDKAS